MAENSRNSKLSSKDDECTFSWKLFTGWDFMIGHAETAHNRIASVVVGFKEALLEEAEKKKDNRNWRIILQRILVNILVMGLLAASGYSVVTLVNKSEELASKYDNWLSRNAVNITMTLLSFFLPMIFEALGLFENWHPRQQLRFQLARIMILNMLNLYSLMFSFIYKINSKEKPLQLLKLTNDTASQEYAQLVMMIDKLKALTTTTTTTTTTLNIHDMSSAFSLDDSSSTSDLYGGGGGSSSTDSALSSTVTAAATALYTIVNRIKCYNVTVKCSKPRPVSHPSLATTTMLLLNLSTTMLPATTTINESFDSTPTTIGTNLWTTESSTDADSTMTATNLLLTTMEQTPLTTTTFEYTTPAEEELTTTTTIVTTTTLYPPTTSTTTPSPGNDSFFEYVDYFEGLPFVEDEGNEGNNEGVNENVLERRQRRAAAAGVDSTTEEVVDQTTEVASQPRKSKYSRRKVEGDTSSTERPTNQNSIKTLNNNEDEEDNNLEKATTARIPILITTTTTRTTKPTVAAILPNANNDNNASTTTATTLDALDASTSLQQQSNQSRLQEVLAYFTTTTTTIEPPVNNTTTIIKEGAVVETTIETDSTDDAGNAAGDDDTTTPYFLDEDEIDEIGEPNYYEPNDVNMDIFGNCIRTVCETVYSTEILPTVTTPKVPTTTTLRTEMTTTVLTPLEAKQKRLAEVKQVLSTVESNLTTMCWETLLGQELSKVIVFDGVMAIAVPLCIDFLRALFVRYLNKHWCWDMEKTFPQYGDFKIAENILTLINNQGQVWMGIFFSPGLVIINLVKLVIMMYFRSWVVLTCNVPHEVVFKASKSNNFYLSLLLTMLFLCVLPVGYAIVWLRPSWHCGPFSQYNRISEFITNTTRNSLPKQLHEPLDYMTSSSTVIPLLLLLILIIYYLVSLTGALREANQDLRTQLQKEREEERKKIFKVPEDKPNEPAAAALTTRWRKVLEASSPVTPSPAPDFETDEYKNQARKELISRIMKQALRKGSATSDEDSVVRHGRDDDDTDTEHHDSLPLDEEGKERRLGLSKLQQIRRTRKPSLVDIVQIAKSERDRAAKMQSSGASKEATAQQQKGANKVEKSAKKDTKKHSPPPVTTPDNDHDPDINSRIVNERRASLLHQKPQDHDKNEEAEAKPHSKADKDKEKDAKKSPTTPSSDANIMVIDEKKSSTETSPQPNENKTKLKRQKQVDPSSPEVFKFDEKSLQRSSHNTKLGRPVDIPTVPAKSPNLNAEASEHSSPNEPTATTPTSLTKQLNTEKLASLSRQGRKKIGSFFALMRDAVNAIKTDNESSSSSSSEDDAGEPKTPKTKPTAATATATSSNQQSQNTAIAMPPTPEEEKPPSLPKTPITATVPTSTSSSSSPKMAPLVDPEELDQARPITFPTRSLSQRRKTIDRPAPIRQDSQTSVWSDNIPTITISHTGSEETIVESDPVIPPPPPPLLITTAMASTPESGVRIIKIQIEDDDDDDEDDVVDVVKAKK